MFNEYTLTALIIIVTMVTIIFAVKDSLHPYVPAGPLFTKAELNFYRYLSQAVDGRALVFGKVRIADVIQPKKSIKGSKRVTALNKIAQKHFDFVLVDPETMNILAAVELNDKTHQQKDRAARDKFVRDAMKSCDIPLIEIPAAKSYDLPNLFKLLAPSLACLQPLARHIETESTSSESIVTPQNTEEPIEPVILLSPEKILAKHSNQNAQRQEPQFDLISSEPDFPIAPLLIKEEILKIENDRLKQAKAQD